MTDIKDYSRFIYLQNFVSAWSKSFRSRPVFPQEVVNLAISSNEFLAALTPLIPQISSCTRLRARTWLRDNVDTFLYEAIKGNRNILIRLDATTAFRFRVLPDGHRWRLCKRATHKHTPATPIYRRTVPLPAAFLQEK